MALSKAQEAGGYVCINVLWSAWLADETAQMAKTADCPGAHTRCFNRTLYVNFHHALQCRLAGKTGRSNLAFSCGSCISEAIFIEIKHSGWKAILPRTRFNFHPGDLLYLWFLVIGSIMLFHSMDWPFGARIGPNVICSILITAIVVSYYGVAFSTRDKMGHTAATPHHGIHMDLDSTEPSNESRISDIYFRAAIFLPGLWLSYF